MQAVEVSHARPRSSGASLYGLYLLSLAVCGLGNLVVRVGARGGWLPEWAGLFVAIAAVAPLIVTAVLFRGLLRRTLDEMLQRIVLEGLAFALITYIPLSALYVNLRTAGVWTPRLDPPDLLMLPALLVAIGIAVARRRYQ